MASKNISRVGLLIAAAVPAAPGLAQEANEAAEDNASEEIVVVGSYLRNRNFDTASPASVLTQDSLDRLGVTSLGDLARYDPALTGSPINTSGNAAGSIGMSRLEVRNLPSLVLLNGRRQVASGTSSAAADISTLVPMIAIEQIEVLKAGAASLYGSDAIGGVVNFRTRDKFEGLEVLANYDRVTEGSQDEGGISALGGVKLSDSLHIVAAVSWYDRSRLDGLDRPFSLLTPNFGAAYPGTYVPTGGAGAGRTFADPNCGTVPTTAVATAANGTTTCTVQNAPYQGLIPATERLQVFIKPTLDVADGIRLYGEFGYNRAESVLTAPGSLPATSTAAARRIVIPRNNPFIGTSGLVGVIPGLSANPASNTVNLIYIGFPFLQIGPDRGLRADNEIFRYVGGLEVELSDGWSVNASYTHSRSRFERRRPEASRSAFQAAINSGAFNPFGSAFSANPGSAEFNTPEDYALFSVDATLEALQKQDVVDAIVTGELFELGGGIAQLAIGGQYRKEYFRKTVDSFALADDLLLSAKDSNSLIERNARAIFAELGLPLFTGFNLQLALRHESFSGGNSTTDPQIGAIWEVTPWLALRGNYATAFRAPELVQFGGSTLGSAIVDDPNTVAVERINLSTNIVGNSALKPESAESYQFGAVLRPLDGLRISVDYFDYRYSDQILAERAQDVINGAPNGPRVIRGTNGAILGIGDLQFINVGESTVRGLDVSADWRLNIADAHRLLFNVAGQFVTDYREEAIPGRPATSAYGTPEISLLGSATWDSDFAALTITGRYFGPYEEFDSNPGPVRFGDQTQVDLQGELKLSKWLKQDVSWIVGVRNIGNELPEFNRLVAEGYDFSSPYDPRGRSVYTTLRLRF